MGWLYPGADGSAGDAPSNSTLNMAKEKEAHSYSPKSTRPEQSADMQATAHSSVATDGWIRMAWMNRLI